VTGDATQVEYNTLPMHADPITVIVNNIVYTFIKWDPTVVVATEDAEYIAQYSGVCTTGYHDQRLERKVLD
jgi:hypothetical protein